MSREDLVKLGEGDAAAWAKVQGVMSPRLEYLFQVAGADQHQAEELASDALLCLVRLLTAPAGRASPDTPAGLPG